MNFHIDFKRTLSLVSVLLLAGCGGGGEDIKQPDQNDTSSPLALKAYDAFSIIEPGQEAVIDLTQYTENAAAVSVVSDQQGCAVPDLNDFKLTLNYESAGYCHYRYVAEDQHGHSETAAISVLATTADQAVLPALSKTININDSRHHHFDLTEALKGVWQSHYIINENVKVVGQFGDGTATATEHTIDYLTADEPSWNTITYTLTDSQQVDAQYIGRIYLAVANDAKSSPVISNTEYDYSAETANVIETRQSVSIDLEALPNFSISNDGDWQLVHVESLSADVEMTDSESVFNKSFNFSTQSVGQHIVSYIVADHYSNYSVGLISIDVIAKESAKSWTDLKVVSNSFSATYSAPALYTEVAEHFSVVPYWDQDAQNTVAAFTSQQGNFYCSEFGSVPMVSEISTLRDRGMSNALDSGDYSLWPKQLNFLARDNQNFNFVKYDLNTGILSPIVGNEPLYLTCVKSDYLSIETLISTATADNFDYSAVMVNKAENEAITVTVIAETTDRFSDTDVTTTIVPIDPSTDRITVRSIKAGDFRLEITGANDTLITPKISFVADRTSASFDQISWDRAADSQSAGMPYLTANSQDSITLTADVIDVNFNPVQEKPVELTITDPNISVSLAPNERLTDENGQLILSLSASAAAIPEGRFDKTITVPMQVGSDIENLQIQLRTEAYLEYIDVAEVVTNHRYTSARIFVRDVNNNALSRTVTITGGQPGSIIQLENEDGYEGTFVVPVEGVRMYFSMIQDNVKGNFTLNMAGSPSRPTVEIPISTRVNRCVGLPQFFEGGTTLPNDWVQSFLEGYDSMVIRRTASAQIGTVTLPSTLLTGYPQENVGKVILFYNLTNTPMRIRQHYNNNEFVTSQVSANSHRYFYFDGDMWAGLTNLFNPGDLYSQWCP